MADFPNQPPMPPGGFPPQARPQRGFYPPPNPPFARGGFPGAHQNAPPYQPTSYTQATGNQFQSTQRDTQTPPNRDIRFAEHSTRQEELKLQQRQLLHRTVMACFDHDMTAEQVVQLAMAQNGSPGTSEMQSAPRTPRLRIDTGGSEGHCVQPPEASQQTGDPVRFHHWQPDHGNAKKRKGGSDATKNVGRPILPKPTRSNSLVAECGRPFDLSQGHELSSQQKKARLKPSIPSLLSESMEEPLGNLDADDEVGEGKGS